MRPDSPPGLLHNIGGPPRATISWRGMADGAGAAAPGQGAARPMGPRGAWLQLTISIGQRDERYRRDWNTAGALLGLVEPGHALGEAAADPVSRPQALARTAYLVGLIRSPETADASLDPPGLLKVRLRDRPGTIAQIRLRRGEAQQVRTMLERGGPLPH